MQSYTHPSIQGSAQNTLVYFPGLFLRGWRKNVAVAQIHCVKQQWLPICFRRSRQTKTWLRKSYLRRHESQRSSAPGFFPFHEKILPFFFRQPLLQVSNHKRLLWAMNTDNCGNAMNGRLCTSSELITRLKLLANASLSKRRLRSTRLWSTKLFSNKNTGPPLH